MDNNLEVFMKRVFLGALVAASLLGFTGCAEYEDSDSESIREQCMEDPHLPFCQETPSNPADDGPSDDF